MKRFIYGTAAVVVALAYSFIAPACLAADRGEGGSVKDKGVAAYVYGEPVTLSEIGADEPDATATELTDRLDEAVAGRVLARQAKQLGLDESPEVKAELERHRRYLLVREMVKRKRLELGKSVEVGDEEIAEFARRMCYTITYAKSEFGEKREAEAFMEKSLRGAPTPWDSQYTVVACEGVGLRMLDRLFKLDEGQMATFGRGTRFYVVKVMDMERTTNPDDLPGWDAIKEYLARKKVDQALDDWIDGAVKKAEVRYIFKPPTDACEVE